jgi:hypothetical protein
MKYSIAVVLAVLLFVSSTTAQSYVFQSGFSALAQNKIFFDLFNAAGSGKTVYVRQIFSQKNFAAVTGVPFQMDIVRTSTVGTGGTALSLVPVQISSPSAPAEITARHAPSGGATQSAVIRSLFFHSEETNQAAQSQEALPLLAQNLIIEPGEGIAFKQITATTAGTYNVWVFITIR